LPPEANATSKKRSYGLQIPTVVGERERGRKGQLEKKSGGNINIGKSGTRSTYLKEDVLGIKRKFHGYRMPKGL